MGLVLADDLLGRALQRIQREVDEAFDAFLPVPGDSRARLVEAMRHAAIGGGKRVRPFLLTLHKAFDEATAVLAGDSLHALAFELLAAPETSSDPFTRTELVQALASASGHNGMAGGQMMDMAADAAALDLHTVTRLQQLKTGALLSAAVEMGAILGKVPEEGRAHLRAYARDIGLAFQIADDLLDHEGDETKAGKALRKDAQAGKATFVSLMGADQARQQAHALSEQAIGHLASHGEEADLLRALARFVVERDR